jgi:hypothetical protein
MATACGRLIFNFHLNYTRVAKKIKFKKRGARKKRRRVILTTDDGKAARSYGRFDRKTGPRNADDIRSIVRRRAT